MADICSAAREKESETGRYVTPTARERISHFDPDLQVKWITNPGMESLMQKVENEIIAALRAQTGQAPTISTPTNTNTTTVKKPVEPEPVDDDDVYACGLFD